MGEAILSGWIASTNQPADGISAADITVVEPSAERRAYLTQTHGVNCIEDISQASAADVVVLSVKPQVMMGMLASLAENTAFTGEQGPRSLFITIAAGLTTEKIQAALPEGSVLVRVMPNMALSIGEGASVGSDCILYPHVTIYYGCKVGNRCILHAGSVVGADGFGFAPAKDGYEKIPQIGIAELEDDVEIGANTCIDRSTMGRTLVRKGVKLDNFVQIAHNVEVGENTVISAQSGIAGSSKVGAWCMIGGQSGVSGHLTIGDKVNFGAKTGALSSFPDNQNIMGYPAIGYRNFLRSSILFKQLPEMDATVRKLQKEIEELKAKLESK